MKADLDMFKKIVIIRFYYRAGDPRDKLRWRNNDVRKNVSKLREIYKSNTDMFDFVDGVLNQVSVQIRTFYTLNWREM